MKQEVQTIQLHPRVEVLPKEFSTHGNYKYVRFADGKVRFCEAWRSDKTHKQLVDEHAVDCNTFLHVTLHGSLTPVPYSAGEIVVKDREWAISSGGSVTAKLPASPSDKKYIEKALSKVNFKYNNDI